MVNEVGCRKCYSCGTASVSLLVIASRALCGEACPGTNRAIPNKRFTQSSTFLPRRRPNQWVSGSLNRYFAVREGIGSRPADANLHFIAGIVTVLLGIRSLALLLPVIMLNPVTMLIRASSSRAAGLTSFTCNRLTTGL